MSFLTRLQGVLIDDPETSNRNQPLGAVANPRYRVTARPCRGLPVYVSALS